MGWRMDVEALCSLDRHGERSEAIQNCAPNRWIASLRSQ
jgi:hypothetical protein